MTVIDWNKVNEADYDCKPSSYNVFLTKSEKESLEFIQKRYSYLLKKQANALSTLVRLIIENTYLYLNNSERSFFTDVENVLNKKYFKDSIDYNFKKRLKDKTKEYEFIQELVRIQLLRVLSNRSIDSDEELIKVSFRLTKNDSNMLKIIGGKVSVTMEEFLSGYLRYFLNLPGDTRYYILTYPKQLKLDRAIREHSCIIINGIKYKPYKIINSDLLILRKNLICFDAYCDSFQIIDRIYDKDIIYTEEYFEFTQDELNVIEAYKKLDYIDISFKVLNDENKDINNLISDENDSPRIVERKHEFPLEKIRIKYFRNIIHILEKANKKNIDYLCYSENYNEFIRLTLDNQEEFHKFMKRLKGKDE